MRKFIIFDLGGILEIHDVDGFCKWIKKKFKLRYEVKEIYSTYKRIGYLLDTDEIDEREFYKRFTSEMGIKIPYEEFYKRYFTYHVKQCRDVLEFIKESLFERYEIYIFSNNSRINVRNFKKKIDFEKLFDKCIYSYDLHIKKPDIDFFKNGLKIIGHKGEECIFIDDQIKSKEPSESMGIKFILYKNLNQLKKDLKALEII